MSETFVDANDGPRLVKAQANTYWRMRVVLYICVIWGQKENGNLVNIYDNYVLFSYWNTCMQDISLP